MSILGVEVCICRIVLVEKLVVSRKWPVGIEIGAGRGHCGRVNTIRLRLSRHGEVVVAPWSS